MEWSKRDVFLRWSHSSFRVATWNIYSQARFQIYYWILFHSEGSLGRIGNLHAHSQLYMSNSMLLWSYKASKVTNITHGSITTYEQISFNGPQTWNARNLYTCWRLLSNDQCRHIQEIQFQNRYFKFYTQHF